MPELGKLLALLAELGMALDISPDPDANADADIEFESGDQPEVVDLDRLLASSLT